MKKIVLVALMALCGASFGFGDARECIDACIHKNPKNKHCAAVCYEAVAVGEAAANEAPGEAPANGAQDQGGNSVKVE